MKAFHALDAGQKKAAAIETNGIAAAGAGSGKTRVLASRYVWLVTEKRLAPEEILTLTFTNKAVSEMYSRIYRYLLDEANGGDAAAKDAAAKAKDALKNFYKAKISTLDSFSAGVARTAAARYGINPEFLSDTASLNDLARDAALRFVLDNREDFAIRELLVDHKIRSVAAAIFARFVIKYSPISRPPEFEKKLLAQKEALLKAWREKTRLLEDITEKMIGELRNLAGSDKNKNFLASLGPALLNNEMPAAPDITPLLEESSGAREQLKKYFDYYYGVIAAHTPSSRADGFAQLVDCFKLVKGKDGSGLFYELESIANYACNFKFCKGIFALLKKFQDEFNVKKRTSGFLSFSDIAHLAVDALKDHPDIRKVYKDTIKMIMVDEFQDNNALQRDLVYLLAEKSGRNEKGIAKPSELEKNRMFFVGDEKQSIYRFRGADVSVFRSLSKDFLGSGETVDLNYNYRSRPPLIAAFNCIFSRVFAPRGANVPDYEAVYSEIKSPESGAEEGGALAHFCFLNKEDLDNANAEGIKTYDLEAAFIAKKIQDMVLGKEKILKRTKEGSKLLPCEWSDFAVLERVYKHQNSLEKYFREFGIPYNTDRPSGLFNDAPILDLRAFLRLIVYPGDRIAYAALIRSPFMRLSDKTLAVCMLSENTEPFAEENEALLPEEDLSLYRRARESFNAIREASRFLSVTELITKLWYEEGYRYQTLWTEQAQVYENLFDLFFSLACDAEAKGKNLAGFIDYLEDVMNREEEPDAREIPGEGEAGVRIMSIHKSKGLEFPVVFIFGCAGSGMPGNNYGLFNYHDQYGLVLKIPQAEELPAGGNYFYNIIEEEEKSKDTAELKRLLYVAMTRAENLLYMTFTLPAQTKEEKKEWDMANCEFNEESIRDRLLQFQRKELKKKTFLTLLAPVLPDLSPSLGVLEPIPVLSRTEIARLAKQSNFAAHNGEKQSQREAALAAAGVYEKAEVIPEGKAYPESLEASKLKVPHQGYSLGATLAFSQNEIDALLEKTALDAAAFGTFVHAVLESRLTGQAFNVPAKIRFRADDEKTLSEITAAAENMADAFMASALGKRWAKARAEKTGASESEFSIITSSVMNGKPIAISGQIDLLFEEEAETVVVDFKTDKTEKSEDHYGQLAAYYQAALDIFGKPVSVWIFYLRSGTAVDVTAAVQKMDEPPHKTQDASIATKKEPV